jgi:hypothetical protein
MRGNALRPTGLLQTSLHAALGSAAFESISDRLRGNAAASESAAHPLAGNLALIEKDCDLF